MLLSNDNKKRSGFRERKVEIEKLLLAREMESLLEMARQNHSTLRALVSFLHHSEPLICNRAAEAIGQVIAEYAFRDSRIATEHLRRLFWMMNDESGNLCRYAPEAIGEILYNIPFMIAEHGPMLAEFLNEEPFEAGVRTAIRRIALKNNQAFLSISEKLLVSLSDPNPAIRGTSVMALCAIDKKSAVGEINNLSDDNSSFEYYDFQSGEMINSTVGKMVEKLLGNG